MAAGRRVARCALLRSGPLPQSDFAGPMNFSKRFQADRLISQIREEADPASARRQEGLREAQPARPRRYSEASRSAGARRQRPDASIYVELLGHAARRQDPALLHTRLADPPRARVSGRHLGASPAAALTQPAHRPARRGRLLPRRASSKCSTRTRTASTSASCSARSTTCSRSEKAACSSSSTDVRPTRASCPISCRASTARIRSSRCTSSTYRALRPAATSSRPCRSSSTITNKIVRQAALAGIARSNTDVDIAG